MNNWLSITIRRYDSGEGALPVMNGIEQIGVNKMKYDCITIEIQRNELR